MTERDLQLGSRVLDVEVADRYRILLDKSGFEYKQYQYEGIKWCVENELRVEELFRGGFIADEMGLGKTITMIGVMFVNLLPKTLIVVPPVLLEQWRAEIYKCSGHKVSVYHGGKRFFNLNAVPIVLTTYNMLCDPDCALRRVAWNRIIFDEAHHLRNCNTTRYYASLQVKSPIRWYVSGTPVQNNYMDYYNLCWNLGVRSMEQMNAIKTTHILRRTKTGVGIQLPDVTTQILPVVWGHISEQLVAEELHSLLPNQSGVSCTKGKLLASGVQGPLAAIIRSRQSCILPSLLKPILPRVDTYAVASQYSSKLDAVIALITSRKDNGKGKIVFCNFRGEIDFVAERLGAVGLSVKTYDGRNSGGNNLKTIGDAMDVLIIQIQTGCEGLNLQENYSEIYFISPHWNPAVEDQAIARCHRIGQKKPVDVFRFEMRGFNNEIGESKGESEGESAVDTYSLETHIMKIQDAKRSIRKEIIQ